MAELKTLPNDGSVKDFLNLIKDERKRKDSFELLHLMRETTGVEPQMWGTSIIGFGSYHYRYASGREGDAPLIGFSPRKRDLSLYITPGFEQLEPLLARLGKHHVGKACLYIKKLEDVDLDVLRELVSLSYEHMHSRNAQS
jgi:hypothetical protein